MCAVQWQCTVGWSDIHFLRFSKTNTLLSTGFIFKSSRGTWEIPLKKVNQVGVYSSYTGRTVQWRATLSVLTLLYVWSALSVSGWLLWPHGDWTPPKISPLYVHCTNFTQQSIISVYAWIEILLHFLIDQVPEKRALTFLWKLAMNIILQAQAQNRKLKKLGYFGN